MLDWPDSEYVEGLDSGDFSADELRHFGTVLARYVAYCAHLGLSY